MKKILLLLFVCCVTIAFAQHKRFKDERRVYLWDVTLSMKGFGGTPAIYDQVVKDLENDIMNIDDEKTELLVLPFQERILDVWKFPATKVGKESLLKKIKEYNNEKVTRTNICTPLQVVMNSYLLPDKRNVLYLFTDGDHNMKSPSKDELYKLLDGWCEFAKKNDVYAFYVMLTENAEKDRKIVNIVESQCNFEVERGVGNQFVLIRPDESRIAYNIKSDEGKPITLTIESDVNKKFPEAVNLRLRVDENKYVEIDEKVSLSESGKVQCKVVYKMKYQQMKNAMPEKMSLPLHITLESKDMGKTKVRLIDDCVELQLINKPEKTLKVYVKD